MTSTEKLDTHRKALTINLDASTFGSFPQIGAGQEVVRWFLLVGGASGTVTKNRFPPTTRRSAIASMGPVHVTFPGSVCKLCWKPSGLNYSRSLTNFASN